MTEATRLLGRNATGARTCVDFFLSGGSILVPSSPASLRRARELLGTYSDIPMDFADATLVVLAEETGTDLVFTTDTKDFSIYRIGGRRPFRSMPR